MQETSNSDSAVNPLHPSFLTRLDPAFVKLYNTHIAHVKPSTDLYELREIHSDKTSDLYRYATAPPTPVAGIGEIDVPGWKKHKGDIQLTVYTPPGEEVGKRQIWPVHFNFHGGGNVVPLLRPVNALLIFPPQAGPLAISRPTSRSLTTSAQRFSAA